MDWKRLRRVLTSRYVAGLEDEVQRLRAEVKQWQEIALRREGLPPLERTPVAQMPQLKRRTTLSQYLRGAERMTHNPEKKDGEAEKTA